MKKAARTFALAFLIALLGGIHLTADGQFRSAFTLTSDFAQKPTLASVQTAFDDRA